jgi:uncharacterized protein (TIGR03118 family)
MQKTSRSVFAAGAVLVAVSALGPARAEAQHYQQTNLVSDIPGMAPITDANLANPWGVARASGSPWWVANNSTGTSTLYNAATQPPTALSFVVDIPQAPPGGNEGGVPTGIVFNGTAGFEVNPGNPARFIFVTEDGTISGWSPSVDPTHAIIKSFEPTAVYTGVAIATHQGQTFLYVANFAEQSIDVYDANFHEVPHKKHLFNDERFTAKGYSPFNVQNIGGNLYVAFALRDPATNDEVAGAGLGAIDVFSPEGELLQRLERGPWLNAPWGLALAPSDFGTFSHSLVVGQFGSGQIAAYDVVSGKLIGMVLEPGGEVLAIEGLWALSFGNGASAGPLNTLFFTAGIEDEEHGLFGALTPIASEQLLGNSP